MSVELADFEAASDLRGATAEQRAQIQQFLAKYLRILDAQGVPKISIHNHLRATWLGQTAWYASRPTSTTIKLQRSILQDARTLERVIAHEVAHHVQLTTLPHDVVSCFQQRRKYCRLPPAHGAEFVRLANEINAAVGDDQFVTEKSDESYVVQQTKSYLLLVALLSFDPSIPEEMRGKYAYSWMGTKPRTERGLRMLREKLSQGARLTTTRRAEFASRGPRFGEGMAVPRDEESQHILEKLFKEAAWENLSPT